MRGVATITHVAAKFLASRFHLMQGMAGAGESETASIDVATRAAGLNVLLQVSSAKWQPKEIH